MNLKVVIPNHYQTNKIKVENGMSVIREFFDRELNNDFILFSTGGIHG